MSIIVHDGAGRGGFGRRLTEVLGHLNERGLEYEVLHTSYAGHATDLAREAIEAGSRFLVACGGDGTINEVVNGMIADDEGSETRVRYFPNIAEVGFGAKVVRRAAKLPRWLGPTIYFCAFWLCLPGHRQVKAKVDLVDRTYDGPVDNLIVANCQFFGGGMQIAPKAAPTDGLLDVQINHVGKKEAIALLPRIYKGQHIPHPLIEEAKRVKLSIETEEPIPIEADGEVLGHTPATFEVIRDVIKLKV